MARSKFRGNTSTLLRRQNRCLVLRRIQEAGALSRSELIESTGLTGAAVSRISRELLDTGILREGSTYGKKSTPGPRFVKLELSETGAYVIGLGIAANKQWVALTNLRGEVIARNQLQLLTFRDPSQTLIHMAEEADDLIRLSGIDRNRLVGGGVSIAGTVDHDCGLLLNEPNLGWEKVPVSDILTDHLGIPFRVESHPNALNLAEARLGVTKGMSNIVLVNVALGIGGSLILDGHLVRGSTNSAGRIGHIHVPGTDQLCMCGLRGCLDTVSSGQAVLTRMGLLPKRDVPKENDVEDAYRLLIAIEQAAKDNSSAVEAFYEAGAALGRAINAVLAINDPEVVVLAGSVGRTKAYLEGRPRHAEPCFTAKQRRGSDGERNDQGYGRHLVGIG